ncbi:Nudix hydrolase 9 [Sesamum angolense]|uniref:Nudix hydrolase 9 n=1 Tax=Sesamum angolense TaxID=2727404 RepID=A0AAE1XCA2_9LAMI|nr:Nudix hydrolase 9 [Sesamum angolense]
METKDRLSEIAGGHDRPAFELLLSCPYGLSPSEVSVVFDQTYDRIPHPDVTLENSISEIWDKRVQKNPSLYNGLKFRYGGHTLSGRADSFQKTDFCLHLGLTDYRTFMGTNLNPLWERFLIPSEDDWRRCQHTSNPLGNGAIVETSDQEIVVLQRSTNVGEFPGHFVFPGGHPELASEIVVYHVEPSMPEDKLGQTSVLDVEQACLYWYIPEVLNVRSAAFFFIKCSLQSKEIQQLYGSAQDGYESTQLYTMSMSEVDAATSKMPGCHQGGFALYKLMVMTMCFTSMKKLITHVGFTSLALLLSS